MNERTDTKFILTLRCLECGNYSTMQYPDQEINPREFERRLNELVKEPRAYSCGVCERETRQQVISA